jgi:uncharacterized protein
MNNRIEIVDALRGFALLGIILIHSVEHFDFFYPPEIQWGFSTEVDQFVMEAVMFLISGKAYSIFALMFGFSFYIQMNRQKNKGVDFRARYIWRLLILMVLGFIHSLFYEGDILLIYAVLGIPLVFLDRLNNKQLYVLALLLFLQIPLHYHFISSLLIDDYQYQETFGQNIWGQSFEVFATGSLAEVMQHNFWNTKMAVWGWSFYNGRFFQLLGLFITGLVLGRNQLFEKLNENKGLLKKGLIISFMALVLLSLGQYLKTSSGMSESSVFILGKIWSSWSHLSATALIVCGFSLVFLWLRGGSLFEYLSTYGRMSLSNYLIQSLFGVFFFYGWGLGMYRYLGSSWSLVYGVLFFGLQVLMSRYWMKNFYYGPFEWLWRAFTFIDFGLKMKRKK